MIKVEAPSRHLEDVLVETKHYGDADGIDVMGK